MIKRFLIICFRQTFCLGNGFEICFCKDVIHSIIHKKSSLIRAACSRRDSDKLQCASIVVHLYFYHFAAILPVLWKSAASEIVFSTIDGARSTGAGAVVVDSRALDHIPAYQTADAVMNDPVFLFHIHSCWIISAAVRSNMASRCCGYVFPGIRYDFPSSQPSRFLSNEHSGKLRTSISL